MTSYSKKTLDDLDWQSLLSHWAKRCTSEQGAALCLAAPFPTAEGAARHLKLVREIMSCIEEGDPPPGLPVRPMGDWLNRIRGEGSASGGALQDIAVNLKLFISISRYLSNRRDVCPANCDLVLPAEGRGAELALAGLAAEIEACFEPDGSMSDQASHELARLRSEILKLRRRLVSRIEKIAEKEADLLQERTVTIRNDRLVLPVRADAHRRLRGIVHGSSGSGATVFVEPESLINDGNDLMLAREEAGREEARILMRLSTAVRDRLAEVESAYRAVIAMDSRIAAARLSVDLHSTVPELAEPGVVQLRDARHPLLALDGTVVVPCTVCSSTGECLVISGPNAGGKTVVLKTVGLLGLMLAAGLPIPVHPDSRLGIPGDLLTDIGDDQSLAKNLSTFSAHMTNITKIISRSKPGSLVLLDELAAGTDPGEGAALAEAILERLNALGATTVATTHFDPLKARAQAGDGFKNAAVGFNLSTMQPTFELKEGIAGSSSALTVALKFGIEEAVIGRAKSIMPRGTRGLAEAVNALEEERHRLALERSALAESRHAADKAEQRAREEREKLGARQNKFIDKEAEDLWSAIRRARTKVQEAEKSIRRGKRDPSLVRKIRREVNEVAEELAGGRLARKSNSDLPGTPAVPSELAPGIEVFVQTFSKKGVIEDEPRAGSVFVRIGNLKTRVNVDDLRTLPGKGTGGGQSKIPRGRGTPAATDTEAVLVQTGENTVDLRGMTVDEAVEAADSFLDMALKNSLGAVFIVHGHGTGALRGAIRSYLGESRYVGDFRPGKRGEGGDGVTVVRLA